MQLSQGRYAKKKNLWCCKSRSRVLLVVLAIVLLWWIGIIWRTITRVDVPKGEKVVANNKAKAKTSKSTTNTSERKKKRNRKKTTPAVSLPGRNSAKVQDKVERRGVAFTISSLGTSKNFLSNSSKTIKKHPALLGPFWNARILPDHLGFRVYTSEACNTRDSYDIKRRAVVRSCAPMIFEELFVDGYDYVIYIDEGVVLGNEFSTDKFKDIFKARSTTGVPPITVVRAEDLPDQNAIIMLDSEGFRDRKYLLNEFLEYWILDLHRKANKRTLEQTLNVAISRTKKLDKKFEAMFVEVKKDIVLHAEAAHIPLETQFKNIGKILIDQLKHKNVIRKFPSLKKLTMRDRKVYSYMLKKDGVKRLKRWKRHPLKNTPEKSLAFTYGDYDLTKSVWVMPFFLWNRLILHKQSGIDLHLFYGQCNRPHSSLLMDTLKHTSTGLAGNIDPHWCRVWIYDYLFLDEQYHNVLYLDADAVLRASFSIERFVKELKQFPEKALFKTNDKEELKINKLKDREALYIVGKSEYGEVDPNTGVMFWVKPSRKVFKLWKATYDGDKWDQVGLKKVMETYPLTYHISPYRILWNHYSSVFKESRYAMMVRGLFELATSDFGERSALKRPLFVRRSLTMVIPIGHHAPPGTDAVRGGEHNGDNRHRNVFYRLRHGDLRKHKILKWDDIKFTPVDQNKDGGAAGVGVGQMGTR